ncbi:MAG: aldehyde dehydrogenase family protein [Acutalibacteraceae bacterium]
MSDEIRHTARHLREWSRPQRVPTPLMHFPGSSRIVREPRGVCLIIAPWNYPFLLAVGPMISAIAAGNCVTLKPSEYAPATAAVLEKMLDVRFEGRFCRTVTGGAEVSAAETARPYDMIFFTGSTAVGRKVMAAAAQNLTPVVLELGGKSPCIVDETADLPVAAARIIWGKLSEQRADLRGAGLCAGGPQPEGRPDPGDAEGHLPLLRGKSL